MDNDQCHGEPTSSCHLLLCLYAHLSKTEVWGGLIVLWMNKSKRTNKDLVQCISSSPRQVRWTSKRLWRCQIPTLKFLPDPKSRLYRRPNRLHLPIITSHQSMLTIISLYKRKQSSTKVKWATWRDIHHQHVRLIHKQASSCSSPDTLKSYLNQVSLSLIHPQKPQRATSNSSRFHRIWRGHQGVLWDHPVISSQNPVFSSRIRLNTGDIILGEHQVEQSLAWASFLKATGRS